jgi:hypothetical protein
VFGQAGIPVGFNVVDGLWSASSGAFMPMCQGGVASRLFLLSRERHPGASRRHNCGPEDAQPCDPSNTKDAYLRGPRLTNEIYATIVERQLVPAVSPLPTVK